MGFFVCGVRKGLVPLAARCFVVVLVSFFFATSQTLSIPPKEEGQYRPGELPVKPRDLDRVMGGTVILHTRKGGFQATQVGRGSAVVLSPNGYLLTALHVIQGAQELGGGILEPGIRISGEIMRGLFSVGIRSEWNSRTPENVFLKSVVIPELGLDRKIQVIALGQDVKEYAHTVFGGRKLVGETFGDWAILKVDSEQLPCVPTDLEDLAPRVGERVWAVGSSGVTARGVKNGVRIPGSDGFSKHVSYGDVLKETDTVRDSYSTKVGAFETSLDIYHGMSGGPIVDEDSLKGIGVYFTMPREVRHVKGYDVASVTHRGAGHYGLSVSHVYEQLEKLIGEDRAREIFGSCPKTGVPREIVSENSVSGDIAARMKSLNREELRKEEYVLELAHLTREFYMEHSEFFQTDNPSQKLSIENVFQTLRDESLAEFRRKLIKRGCANKKKEKEKERERQPFCGGITVEVELDSSPSAAPLSPPSGSEPEYEFDHEELTQLKEEEVSINKKFDRIQPGYRSYYDSIVTQYLRPALQSILSEYNLALEDIDPSLRANYLRSAITEAFQSLYLESLASYMNHSHMSLSGSAIDSAVSEISSVWTPAFYQSVSAQMVNTMAGLTE